MTTWVKELLRNLDDHVDDPTRKALLGACGEKCPFTHLPDDKLLGIKKESSSDIDFLNKLCNQWRMVKEDGEYYVLFDQCYCPLVSEDIEGTSKTLCYCTLGNLKHKFKLGLDQEVEVEMQKTILGGDEECRFHVKIENQRKIPSQGESS